MIVTTTARQMRLAQLPRDNIATALPIVPRGDVAPGCNCVSNAIEDISFQ
jgi:hypothetical protein